MLEDTKVAIRSRNSKKDRQSNRQNIENKRTNNDKTLHRKLKIGQHESHKNRG